MPCANNCSVLFLKCKSGHISVFIGEEPNSLGMTHEFLHDLGSAMFYFPNLLCIPKAVLSWGGHSPPCVKWHTAPSSSPSVPCCSPTTNSRTVSWRAFLDTTSSSCKEVSVLGTNSICLIKLWKELNEISLYVTARTVRAS